MYADTIDDVLELADGTKINPLTGKVIREIASGFIEIPSGADAQEMIARTRRTVADLPLPPDKLSGVALVAFYVLFGLHDNDIAIALNGELTVLQIKQIKKLDAYNAFMTSAKENIMNSASNAVRDIFTKNAQGAAMKVVELAQSDSDVLAFKASQDILDRAGHRPADVVEHRHKMEDSLNIVITHKNDNEEVPMINITPKVIEHDNSL